MQWKRMEKIKATGKIITLMTKMAYFWSKSAMMRRRYSKGRMKSPISVFKKRKKTSSRMMVAAEYSPVLS